MLLHSRFSHVDVTCYTTVAHAHGEVSSIVLIHTMGAPEIGGDIAARADTNHGLKSGSQLINHVGTSWLVKAAISLG